MDSAGSEEDMSVFEVVAKPIIIMAMQYTRGMDEKKIESFMWGSDGLDMFKPSEFKRGVTGEGRLLSVDEMACAIPKIREIRDHADG